MIYLCIATVSALVPLGIFIYNKWLSFEKRIHDLHMKELMLNYRCNVLEDLTKQMEMNIMTFSLDLHAHEKKCDNRELGIKEHQDELHIRISKIENEMINIREKFR
jgi:hypothetical protein